MRYTWIDGLYVKVSKCGECPFIDMGDGGWGEECRYPHKPSKKVSTGFGKSHAPWCFEDYPPDDCPLKVIE